MTYLFNDAQVLVTSSSAAAPTTIRQRTGFPAGKYLITATMTSVLERTAAGAAGLTCQLVAGGQVDERTVSGYPDSGSGQTIQGSVTLQVAATDPGTVTIRCYRNNPQTSAAIRWVKVSAVQTNTINIVNFN